MFLEYSSQMTFIICCRLFNNLGQFIITTEQALLKLTDNNLNNFNMGKPFVIGTFMVSLNADLSWIINRRHQVVVCVYTLIQCTIKPALCGQILLYFCSLSHFIVYWEQTWKPNAATIWTELISHNVTSWMNLVYQHIACNITWNEST